MRPEANSLRAYAEATRRVVEALPEPLDVLRTMHIYEDLSVKVVLGIEPLRP